MFSVNVTWVDGVRSLVCNKTKIEPQPETTKGWRMEPDGSIFEALDPRRNATMRKMSQLSGYDDFAELTSEWIPGVPASCACR